MSEEGTSGSLVWTQQAQLTCEMRSRVAEVQQRRFPILIEGAEKRGMKFSSQSI